MPNPIDPSKPYDIPVGPAAFTTAHQLLPYGLNEIEVAYLLRTGLVAMPVATAPTTATPRVAVKICRVHAEVSLKVLRFSLTRTNAKPRLPSADRAATDKSLLDARVFWANPIYDADGTPTFQVRGVYVWALNTPVFEEDGFPGCESPVVNVSPTSNTLTPELFSKDFLG